jgi:F-type H+-transporting ATPase subunit b
MTIDWWTLALQAINFLVLVWLMQHFLYKPVKDIIERRRNISEQAIREGEQAKKEAKAAKEHYDEQVAELSAERQRMLDDAHRQISEEQQKAMDAARADAEILIGAGRKAVAAEKETALSDLRGETANLAVEIAAKILREAGIHVPNDIFLQVLNEKITGLPKNEYDRLIKDLAEAGSGLTVITANPLNKEDKKKWHKQLCATLEMEVSTKFETDPSLIGGAELQFPHANVKLSWAENLDKVKDQLVGGSKSS